MSNLNKSFKRWKEVILITFVIKIILFCLSLFTNPLNMIIHSFVRWDGPHYIEIAKNGYQAVGEQSLFIVFYPLYPFLIKIISLLTFDFYFSSILISLFFSFTASILLYELTVLDFSPKNALKAVWFLNIFPTAYFLQASYTESLFLTLSLLTIYLYRKDKFFFAGVIGALTTFTRVNGLLLIPLLFLEKRNKRTLFAFILLPLGFLNYLLINYLIFGDIFYFTKPLLTNWYKKLEYPWVGINNLINSIPPLHHADFYIRLSELLAIIFILIFTILVYLKVKKSYALYVLLNLLLITSTSYILGTPRYALSLFPIFMALGLIKSKKILIIISLVFLSLLFYFTILYTLGKWAF